MKLLFSLVFSLIFTTSAYAESLQNSIKQCGKIKSSPARLACFDALTTSLTVKPLTTKNLAKAEPKNTAPDGVVKTPTKLKSEQQKVEEFGAHHLKQKNDANEKITLIVSSVSKDTRKNLRITFENNQVWKQTDNAFFKLKVNDKVELIKGVLGAIYLKKPDKNKKIRVKRIK